MRYTKESPLRETGDHVKPALALLVLLVSADLAFILLHQLNVETQWLRGVPTSLEAEFGLPESFQYIKAFWIVVSMGIAFAITRTRVYASWAVVFAFFLFDDSLKIHERVGTWLGRRHGLPSAFGLRPDDTGEMIVAAVMGVSMLALVGLALRRGCEQSTRIARDVLLLVVALAIPAVVVDQLHVVAYVQRSLWAQVLLIVEDGGEMIVMSALTAYAFHVASHSGRTRLDLWAMLRARAGTALGRAPRRPWAPAAAGGETSAAA
jgi:hypothetical protein